MPNDAVLCSLLSESVNRKPPFWPQQGPVRTGGGNSYKLNLCRKFSPKGGGSPSASGHGPLENEGFLLDLPTIIKSRGEVLTDGRGFLSPQNMEIENSQGMSRRLSISDENLTKNDNPHAKMQSRRTTTILNVPQVMFPGKSL